MGFMKESSEIFGYDVPTANIAMAFTIRNGVVPFSMILVGLLQKKYSAKLLIIASGGLFCLGYIITGFTVSLTMLYITYGVMVGLGASAVYNIVMSNLIPFFPDKKGLVTGIMTSTYGASSIICAPIMQHFISSVGTLYNFRIMGILFGLGILTSSVFIKQRPDLTENASVQNSKSSGKIIIKDKIFPFVFVVFTTYSICGLLIISQSGAMAEEIGGIADVAVIVSTVGAANVTGRIFWGWISDKAGRYNTLIIMCAVMATNGLLLIFMGEIFAVFIISAVLVVFSYGGCMGVIPPLLVENFGSETSGINYGILCIGYAIGAYIGPIIGSSRFTETGSYDDSFKIIFCSAMTGLLCLLITKLIKRKASE